MCCTRPSYTAYPYLGCSLEPGTAPRVRNWVMVLENQVFLLVSQAFLWGVSPSKAVQWLALERCSPAVWFLGYHFKQSNFLLVNIARFGVNGYDHNNLVTPDLWWWLLPRSSVGVVVILAVGWFLFWWNLEFQFLHGFKLFHFVHRFEIWKGVLVVDQSLNRMAICPINT